MHVGLTPKLDAIESCTGPLSTSHGAISTRTEACSLVARGGATAVSTSRNAESQPPSRLTADWLAGCNIQSWATSVEISQQSRPTTPEYCSHALGISNRPLPCPSIVCTSVGLLSQGRSLSIGQLTAAQELHAPRARAPSCLSILPFNAVADSWRPGPLTGPGGQPIGMRNRPTRDHGDSPHAISIVDLGVSYGEPESEIHTSLADVTR